MNGPFAHPDRFRGEEPTHIAIIGGGASGVLLAAQLLSRRQPGLVVTMIETRDELGCGLAYSTPDPNHLLNTRVSSMSAFPDRPGHFAEWLSGRAGFSGDTGPQAFVSRSVYGSYLSDLVEPWRGVANSPLRCLKGECVRITETAEGVTIHMADGSHFAATAAVLATGHVLPQRDADDLLSDPWDAPSGHDPDGRVLILGTGLTMIDQVLSLIAASHRGEIVALSRRGLLPRSHRVTKPLAIPRSAVPIGATVSTYVRWARGLARRAEAEGGTWRDAVDGIRPHVRAIWRSLPVAERARFLRHAAGWWDVHRHRVPPESEQRIGDAIARGQLRFLRGGFVTAARQGDGILARIAPRAQDVPDELVCTRIVDCRGIRRDPEHNASPLVADLIARGEARIDPLRIGLEVTHDCRLIRRDGSRSERLLAIGPVSRAAFWEITAVPDIREQTAAIATDLAAGGHWSCPVPSI